MNIGSKTLLLSFGLITLLSGCGTSVKVNPDNNSKQATAGDDYKLVWSDEFNYQGLPDSVKWSYDVGDGCPNVCGWGNEELEYYTDKILKNARVENGVLTIEVHKEPMGSKEYTSARLVTKGKGDWLYGRFIIRAKLPKGIGTWPAVWMLPTDWEYGGWPKSGEIDIMEYVGYDPDTVVASAHTASYNHKIGTHKNARVYLPDANENFHTYMLEWEPDEYRVYVDGGHIFTFKNEHLGFSEWPFDKSFHLILNIAFGGSWGGSQGIDDKALPAKMTVDYVRVYQK